MNHGFLLVTRVGEFVEDERELARLWLPFLVGRAASNWETMRQARERGVPIPPIYSCPIVWYTDPPGVQYLFSVLEVLAQGWGDCKALICIRMAELAEQGFRSTPRILWRSPRELPPGSGAQMHAQLRHDPYCRCQLCKHQPEPVRKAGFIEEPSRLLGM